MMLFTENKQALVESIFPFIGSLTGDMQVAVTLMAVIVVGLVEFGLMAIFMGSLFVLMEQHELRFRRQRTRQR